MPPGRRRRTTGARAADADEYSSQYLAVQQKTERQRERERETECTLLLGTHSLCSCVAHLPPRNKGTARTEALTC